MKKAFCPYRSEEIDKEFHLSILEHVYLTRIVDEKCNSLAKQNKGGNFHLCAKGHELIGVVGGLFLQGSKHWGFPYYRDRGFAIAKGASITELFAAFLARDVVNHSGGRQMPEHYSDANIQIACQSSVVGSQILQAVGRAKASQISGKKEISYVSFGDGATSQGDFHEAMNFATIHELPVIFVVQDNEWAISVPKIEQTSGGSIAQIAKGYSGLQVLEIDGCDVEQVIDAYQSAIKYADQGPSLIIASVPRIGAHSSSDNPKKYKSEKDVFDDKKRDPVPRVEQWMLKNRLIDMSGLQSLYQSLKESIEDAIDKAEKYPFAEDVDESDAYKKSNVKTLVRPLNCEINQGTNAAENKVMSTQINHALIEEMRRDEKVVVFGQDVAKEKGGVFGVTENLTEIFGDKRCFNTPLAESTIAALALGLSLKEEIIPVCEVQFADYIWTCVNQLFNEIATYFFRSNGLFNLPLVIRMPCGGYIQGGPYHSQSIEAVLAHVPGLKVVMPSTAADAKRLLKGAIRDPNPVIFLEHKALYRQHAYVATPEPLEDEIQELGVAKIACEGDEMTVVTWGMMTMFAVEIVRDLEISVEVIDLMTISPYDEKTILESVKKTGKVLVLHEAVKRGGFGGEIASMIAEKAFDYLDAPPRRIGALALPVPYSKKLESIVLPQRDEIRDAIEALYRY